MMLKLARKFFDDESGAVTVDWVVLTAGVVGMGFLAVGSLIGNTGTLGDRIGSYLSTVPVN